MLAPRGSLLLAYVGDYFVDRIDHRLRRAEHDVVRRTRDGAVDAARRKLRRLLMHRNHNLGSPVEVRVEVFRVR